MTMKKLFLFISITSLCGIHLELKAEPWLSTRFAQNCSGCHAPQRINKKPMDRRCTLSCQGCHVNPNGGAIALGHPLGMSGARLVTTAAYELQRSGGRYALCTMCIGVGQGIALIIERV